METGNWLVVTRSRGLGEGGISEGDQKIKEKLEPIFPVGEKHINKTFCYTLFNHITLNATSSITLMDAFSTSSHTYTWPHATALLPINTLFRARASHILQHQYCLYLVGELASFWGQ